MCHIAQSIFFNFFFNQYNYEKHQFHLVNGTFLSVNGQEREPEPWLRVISQEYSTLTQSEAKKIERLVEKGIYSDYWIVHFYALQHIIQDQQLSFSLPGQDFTANFSESWLGNNSNGHVVWEGKTKDEDGYAILLMDERTVFGHIKYQGEDFMIHSMEESNTSVIFKQGKSSTSSTENGCGAPDPSKVDEAPIQDDPASNGRFAATSNCDTRVLVYFTPRANNATANITQLALITIAETNAAFINSDISQNTVSLVSAGVELLSPFPAGWTEDDPNIQVSITDDIEALVGEQVPSDPNDRRNATGADIVICLTGDVYPGVNGTVMSFTDNASA